VSFAVRLEHPAPSMKVVLCSGELEIGSCAKLIDAIEMACEPGLAALRIDLREVTFIDSTGIGCLIHGSLGCRRSGTRFEVVPGQALLDSPLANQLPQVAADDTPPCRRLDS